MADNNGLGFNSNSNSVISNKDSGILVSQLNLHKSLTPTEYINSWFNSKCNYIEVRGKIALLQEPYLANRNKQPTGFNKDLNVFVGASTGKIRACVVTEKSVNAWKLTQFSNNDICTIGVKSNGKIFILVSGYFPYDSPDFPPDQLVKNLAVYCRSKGWGLTISSDANSHNILWGSSDTNGRGEVLADWIFSSDLHICNKGNKPTFCDVRREEVIDVTFCSTNMLDCVENWHVSDDLTFSDHNRIEFYIVTDMDVSNPNPAYRNVRKTDFIKYNNILKDNIISCTGTTLDDMANELEEAIMSAYKASCKEQKASRKKKPQWWTKDLTQSQKKVKKLRQKAIRFRSEENSIAYRDARRDHNYAIRNARSLGWSKLCSEMESLSTTARIQKVLKMGRKQDIGTIRKPDGSYTDSPEETLKVLLDIHFPDKLEEEQIPQERLPLGNLDIEGIVNEQSVRAAFKSFKPYKAPGTDGIFPILIQKGMDVIVDLLVKIFRKSLREGKSPKRWLESKIVFIPKPGKLDYGDPKSLRPLSLTSFFFKGIERTIHWHILKTSLRYNKFHKNLYSYRESISTEDILHKLMHKVEKALEKKEMVIVLFADISAAFSTANISGMIRNMQRKGIEPGIINWITDALVNRQAIATLNGETVIKMVDRGTPQGGVLSVNYWNANMDDLLERFPAGESGDVNAFADDLMDMIGGIDEATMVRIIQNDIRIMERWANDHSLTFSASKTKVMLFTNRRKYRKLPLFMDGKEIEYVDSFKYLGITLDTKLTFTKHIENISKRAAMTMAQCRRMIAKNWGLKPHICKWVYTSLIRPIMSYSCFVWINSINKVTHIDRLQKVQRQGCLATLNAMKSTPTAGMEVILDIRPIDIHLQELAISSYIRLSRNGNWIPKPGEVLGHKAHSNIILSIVEEIPEVRMPIDNLLNKDYLVSNFKTTIKSREEVNLQAGNIKLTPEDQDSIHVFTDGSKTNFGSGCAYIFRGPRGTGVKAQDYLTLGRLSTVFQAEVFAIGEASRKMINMGLTGKVINFFVDSQAAILSLDSYIVKTKTVLDSKNSLNTLGAGNDIRISWIPSHIGILGNEVADKLAKRGSYLTGEGPEPFLPTVSKAHIKSLIRKWSEEKHQERWSRPSVDFKETKMLLPYIRNKAWKTIKGKGRRGAMYATQILTGHACVQKHLFKMNFADNPGCRKCDHKRESIEHLLGSCPAHNILRRDVLGDYTIPSGDMCRLNLNKIFRFFSRAGSLENSE